MTKLCFPSLKDRRIELCQLDLKYLEDMHEYSSMPEMFQHFEFGHSQSIYETQGYLQALMERSSREDANWWFVVDQNTRKAIGSIGVHGIDLNRKSCEISYALSPAYWGQGLFHEAAQLVLNFLFNELQMLRISAVTSDENLASIRALLRLGFRKEGCLRRYYWSETKGHYDACVLAVLRDEANNKGLKK